MTSKPYFSLFGPAIRPHLYQDVYDSISDGNDIPFEIVFSGDIPPAIEMPDNFRYIYSEDDPGRCWELAARESSADLMIPITDDVKFSKNFLNRAYYYTTIFDLDKILISFRLRFKWGKTKNGVAVDEGGFIDQALSSSPTSGLSGIYRKDLWEKLGGLDSRFYGGFADLDMMLRFYYELGMSSFITPDCSLSEINSGTLKRRSLLRRSNNPRVLLESLWMKDGVYGRKRYFSVESHVYE